MKKDKWLHAVVMLSGLFLTMVSCQKQVDEHTTATIFGKWKVKSAVGESYILGTRDTTSYTGTSDDYFEFSQSYMWQSHFQNDVEQSPFTMAGSKIRLTARDEFPNEMEIRMLTNQRLILYAKAKIDSLPYPQGYQEMTINLEK